MQPLYPSFCFGDHDFQDPSMRKKALAMQRFEVAQLHDSAWSAKFDGEVGRRNIRRSFTAKNSGEVGGEVPGEKCGEVSAKFC